MNPRARKMLAILAVITALSTIGAAIAQDHQEAYDDIAAEMSGIRELELLEPLSVEEKTREQLREDFRDDLETDYPAEDRENDQRVLVALGLMEPEDDLGELYVNLLGEAVGGYYDPESNEMVVVQSNEGPDLSALQQTAFAHETVHALQDQNFDLEPFIEMRMEGTSDLSLAVTALIEGDASLAEIDFLLSDMALARAYLEEAEGLESGAFDEAPPILAQTLYFPYEYGFLFAQFLFDEGGWDLINEAYDNPPTTTEQILHPEKYLEGEAGVEVDVPDLSNALGAGWQTIDDDTMGEFQTSILLADSELSEGQVQTVSEGWGGDAYTVSATGDDIVIAWSTVWDSEEDAGEFARALALREQTRFDADPEQTGDSVVIVADDAVVQLVRNGATVTYVQAPDGAVLETVLEELGQKN